MNKVSLMGRLTRDVETRATASGTPVCNFSLAVPRRFSKDKEVDFINIVAWNKTAEFCSKYFVKGQQVALVGRIFNSNWDDADGKKRYKTEIVAEEVYFAESKKDSAQAEGEANNPYAEQTTFTKGTDPKAVTEADNFYPVVAEDDLPF